MTSELAQTPEAFVWIWLPGNTEPVVAGRITQDAERFVFNYGATYLKHTDAIPIYAPELPLRRGFIEPGAGLTMARFIRDGSPDAWGRRVIMNRLVGAKAGEAEVSNISEISYLLASGSDRIGALDFQTSATNYVPRHKSEATYEELIRAADLIERAD